MRIDAGVLERGVHEAGERLADVREALDEALANVKEQVGLD